MPHPIFHISAPEIAPWEYLSVQSYSQCGAESGEASSPGSKASRATSSR
jgi:hypothetical protein